MKVAAVNKNIVQNTGQNMYKPSQNFKGRTWEEYRKTSSNVEITQVDKNIIAEFSLAPTFVLMSTILEIIKSKGKQSIPKTLGLFAVCYMVGTSLTAGAITLYKLAKNYINEKIEDRDKLKNNAE